MNRALHFLLWLAVMGLVSLVVLGLPTLIDWMTRATMYWDI